MTLYSLKLKTTALRGLFSLILSISFCVLVGCDAKLKTRNQRNAGQINQIPSPEAATPKDNLGKDGLGNENADPQAPGSEGHPDKTAPTIAFVGIIDKTVRRGGNVPLSLTVDGTGSNIVKLTYSYASDGENFGPEVEVAEAVTNFDAVVPLDTPSAQAARWRVTVTDEGGNKASAVSPTSMLVLAEISRFFGQFEMARAQSEGPAHIARFETVSGMAADENFLYFSSSQAIHRSRLSDGHTIIISGGRTSVTKDGVKTGAYWRNGRSMTIMGKKLYVTDLSDHVLRMVDIDEQSPDFGKTTTIAGEVGVWGTDDTSANNPGRFRSPFGIAHDGTYLYIADQGSHTIRRVNPADGSISTIAGLAGSAGSANGAGSVARFNMPRGVFYDKTKARLYVSEEAGRRIREINPADNTVSTLSGNGGSGYVDGPSASVQFPFMVEMVSDGTFAYVTDLNAQTIRRANLSDGAVSTFVGTRGVPGYTEGTGTNTKFTYPHALAINSTHLFVADLGNGMIRKVSLDNGTTSYLMGQELGTTPSASIDDASLGSPKMGLVTTSRGIVSDNGDDIYLTSALSTIVHMKISTNSLTIIAGQSYVGGSSDGIGTNALFNSPRGIVKINNDLFIADTNNHIIRRIDLSTNTVTTIAGTTGVSGTSEGDGTAARFNAPYGLASDDTYLYIADTGNRRIRRMLLASPHTVSTLAGSSDGYAEGTGASARFREFWNITLHGTDLYVADRSNHAIRKVDTATGAVETVAGAIPPTAQSGTADGNDPHVARFSYPSTITRIGTTLYIAEDGGGYRLRAMDLSNGQVSTVAGGPSEVVQQWTGTGPTARIRAVSMTAQGGKLLFFGDSQAVFSIDPATRRTSFIGPASRYRMAAHGAHFIGSRHGKLIDDSGDAFAPCVTRADDHIYFPTTDGRIMKARFDGSDQVVLAGRSMDLGYSDGVAASARFGRIFGCTVHGDYMYFGEAYNHTLRRIHRQTGFTETIAGAEGEPGLVDGVGAAARFKTIVRMATHGDAIYFSEAGNHAIRRISLANDDFATVTTIAGNGSAGHADGIGGAAQFYEPQGIAILGNKLYVADLINRVVRAVDLDTRAVTTIAGTVGKAGNVDGPASEALFEHVINITTDGQDLFIGDSNTNTLRRLRMSTGEVSTFVGTPYQYSGRLHGRLGDEPLGSRGTLYFLKDSFYNGGGYSMPIRLH